MSKNPLGGDSRSFKMSDDNQNQDQEIDLNNPKIQAYIEEQVKGLKNKNSELLGSLKDLKDF